MLAGSAAAVPISMDPGAVTVSGLGKDFTLTFDSGDTSDNRLNFSIAGEISDLDHVINGIAIPEMGTVTALLIDRFSPSSGSFFVETSATPTIATIYGLSVGDIGEVACIGDVLGNIVDSKTLRFSAPGTPVPEPTAALVFAVGFLVVQASCRRH